MALDKIADGVAVIRLVDQHDRARRQLIQKRIGDAAISHVAAGQDEAERAAFAVGEGMELLLRPSRLILIARAPAATP